MTQPKSPGGSVKVIFACVITLVLATIWHVAPARAHPHILVNAEAELRFDGQGRLAAVRNIWHFDPMFSAYATQGFDADGDGNYTREELQPLAEINMNSLSDFEFFTWVAIEGKVRKLAPPEDYWLEYDGNVLTLRFTLPLAEPIHADGDPIVVDVYDPDYYVAYQMADGEPAVLIDSPEPCHAEVRRPEPLDSETAMELAEIPADVRELPPELAEVTADLVNRITIRC